MTSQEYADGLRMIADHYEQNPDMPVPGSTIYMFCNEREEFIKASLGLSKGGRIEKTADPEDAMYPQFKSIRQFGKVGFQIRIDRKQICRLIRAAEYDCPDSLLEEATEYTEAK